LVTDGYCYSKNSLVLTHAECELNLPLFIVPKHLFSSLFHDSLGKLYQKSITNLDFNEARDDGVAVASAGPYANDLHLITLFYRLDALPDAQPTVSKH